MQVVTKGLQLHPREPGLWVYAAAHEFEHNRNAAASRALNAAWPAHVPRQRGALGWILSHGAAVCAHALRSPGGPGHCSWR